MTSKQESALQMILTPFAELKAACFEHQLPKHCMLVHFRNWLRLSGLLPLRTANKRVNYLYRLGNTLLLFVLLLMALSLTADLYDASNNIVTFGDDLVMLLGMYLIWTKQLLYSQCADVLQEIVLELDALHISNAQSPCNESRGHLHQSVKQRSAQREVIQLQRIFFIVELTVNLGYAVIGLLFVAALCLHPLVTHDPLPMRCRYPFGLEQQSQARPAIYLLQCIYLSYEIYSVLMIDSIACTCCTQIAVNLRILCLRLRAMTLNVDDANATLWHQLRSIVLSHQQIINLVERINDCLYWGYVAQMGASTFIICLTAFEALVAKDEPLVAIKFQVYMFTAFMQLFYWCLIGNIMYFDSLEVANAAFELHCWYDESPALQRNLMFIIQRAQKPLLLQPKPLFGFNFATFANILSTSYSYFTLLRTMIE